RRYQGAGGEHALLGTLRRPRALLSRPCFPPRGPSAGLRRASVYTRLDTARASVEKASAFGWTKFVGDGGESIGMRTFGASAPLKDLLKEFGFTVDRVAEAAKKQLKRGAR